MPTTYKVLGQSAPGAATDTTLYTVPAATSTVVSTINVCNRAATSDTFRIAIRPAGATLANQHYIAFDTLVLANDSITITAGISLAATDVITVRGTTANLSFTAFGAEMT
jgi:glucose-6-phosphate dehydrogenase assembly protein OpcA